MQKVEFTSVRKDLTAEQLTSDMRMELLRHQREIECFSVVNRGKVWYDTLTPEQYAEVVDWYKAWLNVTTSRAGVPAKPTWLK